MIGFLVASNNQSELSFGELSVKWKSYARKSGEDLLYFTDLVMALTD